MDWQALLKTIAPWIGTAIGGPLGGMALTAAASAFGISEPTTEKLKAALAGITPEQSLALQNADQSFQETMTKLGFDHIEKLESLAVEDRKDARAMQVAAKSPVPALLATIIVGGYMLCQWFLLTHVVDGGMRDIVLRSLGTVDMALGLVLSFYFGSSAGSQRKDELAAGAPPASNKQG